MKSASWLPPRRNAWFVRTYVAPGFDRWGDIYYNGRCVASTVPITKALAIVGETTK